MPADKCHKEVSKNIEKCMSECPGGNNECLKRCKCNTCDEDRACRIREGLDLVSGRDCKCIVEGQDVDMPDYQAQDFCYELGGTYSCLSVIDNRQACRDFWGCDGNPPGFNPKQVQHGDRNKMNKTTKATLLEALRKSPLSKKKKLKADILPSDRLFEGKIGQAHLSSLMDSIREGGRDPEARRRFDYTCDGLLDTQDVLKLLNLWGTTWEPAQDVCLGTNKIGWNGSPISPLYK
jgi:hypothetical protein